MGAEKRLQRKLNRMGKKKGNTVDIEDSVGKKLKILYKIMVQKVKNVEQQNFTIK